FLDLFSSVEKGEAACGTAWQTRQRVIIEDVATNPIFESSPGARETMLAAGARAVQSTPLLTRSGEMLGTLSTHYREPYRPSERELRLLDLLARQAADLIERKRAETALLAREAELRRANRDLEQFAFSTSHDLQEPVRSVKIY